MDHYFKFFWWIFFVVFSVLKKNFHRSNLIGFVMDIEKLKMEFWISNEIKVFIFDSVLFCLQCYPCDFTFYFVVVVDRIASLLWSQCEFEICSKKETNSIFCAFVMKYHIYRVFFKTKPMNDTHTCVFHFWKWWWSLLFTVNEQYFSSPKVENE